MRPFERFVGIDWSGAKPSPQKGIAIAVAGPGSAAPKLVTRGAGHVWSRGEVVDWIASQVGRRRVLVGIDFAFGFPPLSVSAMSWVEVERHCADDSGFYGGRFFSDRRHPYGDYVNGPWGKGDLFSARHYRTTEREAKTKHKAHPTCMLNAVGPSAVGFSSASGMRALVRLRERLGGKLAIWPFDALDGDASVLVEIFPRLYPILRGQKHAMRSVENLNAALAAFGCEPFPAPVASEDVGDAVISAAALRALSADPTLWGPLPTEARHEGWIFGVRPCMTPP